MERFTISLDESLARQFDALIAARGYANRSEAVRDLIRGAIEGDRQRDPPAGHCVANLSYIYNHRERELAERLTSLQHDHHDLTVAAMHTHRDHDNCLETVILKGAAVRRFAEALMAERGVRHGQLNVIVLETEQHHAHDAHGQAHVHYRPARCGVPPAGAESLGELAWIEVIEKMNEVYKLHAAAEDHMQVVANEPERVKAYSQDSRVKYAVKTICGSG